MEPRAIDPQDIRVGDRVRQTFLRGEDAQHNEFTVVDRCVNHLRSAVCTYLLGPEFSWTLLYHPEPPREVGSRWQDPETDAEYIKTDDNGYVRYRKGNPPPGVLEFYARPEDSPYVARLVPLDGER